MIGSGKGGGQGFVAVTHEARDGKEGIEKTKNWRNETTRLVLEERPGKEKIARLESQKEGKKKKKRRWGRRKNTPVD